LQERIGSESKAVSVCIQSLDVDSLTDDRVEATAVIEAF